VIWAFNSFWNKAASVVAQAQGKAGVSPEEAVQAKGPGDEKEAEPPAGTEPQQPKGPEDEKEAEPPTGPKPQQLQKPAETPPKATSPQRPAGSEPAWTTVTDREMEFCVSFPHDPLKRTPLKRTQPDFSWNGPSRGRVTFYSAQPYRNPRSPTA
jgi:hypothetical protein